MPADRPRRERHLLERMARAVLDNAQGEYSAEEVGHVRDTLDNRPDELRAVLDEIHAARKKGGERCTP